VPRKNADSGLDTARDATTTKRVMTLLGPRITLSAEPSAPIPTADPRLLFWVTGVVLGVLALWVLYVTFAGETRKAPPSADPKTSSDGAE